MGMPGFAKALDYRLRSLPPKVQSIRQGVKEFFQRCTRDKRHNIVRSLRVLAQFMRMERAHWPGAVDRIFAGSYQGALATLDRYREWLNRMPISKMRVCQLQNGGVKMLSSLLKAQGLIKWEIKHRGVMAAESRWNVHLPEFRQEIKAWVRFQKARFASPTTIRHQLCELDKLGQFLRSKGLSYTKVQYADALAWLEHLRDSGATAMTYNGRLRMAKRFYAWLRARKVIVDSPFETFKGTRQRRVLPQILTEGEVVRLLRAATPGRDRAMFEVMYASGARAGDIRAMDLENISFQERTARTIAKGDNETILYLNNSSLRAIKAYLPLRSRLLANGGGGSERALFLCRGGRRVTTFAIRNAARLARGKAGIKKRVHPHLLRHSFATHLLNRGADLFSIMQFMGHKDIQSTVRYLQVATERLSDIHRRFHPRK